MNVSDVDWPTAMLAAPNALASVGAEGTGTLTDADAVLPAPLCVELIFPVVLALVPAEVAVTLTLHVHDASGARLTLSIAMKVDPGLTLLMLPPQVLVSPFGDATTSPPGRLSAKLMLVNVVNVGFGLAMLNVSDVDWPTAMLAAPNALASVGAEGTGTLTDADAVLPAPLCVELIFPVVLALVPAEVAVTLTLHVHDASGARLTLSIAMKVDPGLTLLMLPPQVLVSPFGDATTSPPGRLSAKLMLVNVVNVGFGLAMLNVSDVDWPTAMLAAPNALASVGAEGTGTLTDADAVLPAPLCVELIFPVVLALVPAEVAVTLTLHVHDASGARLTLSIAMKVDPGLTLLMLPPQVLVSPVGDATTSPPGRLSAKLMLVSVVPGFGLVTVNVSEVDWPIRMLAAPNALASVGGSTAANAG